MSTDVLDKHVASIFKDEEKAKDETSVKADVKFSRLSPKLLLDKLGQMDEIHQPESRKRPGFHSSSSHPSLQS
jgi:hypothetical protein